MASAKPKKTAAKKSAVARKRSSTNKASGRKSTARKATEEPDVVVDRRTSEDRRHGADRRKTKEPVAVERRKLERRAKVNRRRQIDPTTCERDYSPDEIEFMNALDEYKRASGRMFPTCSEILEVIKGLGYEKVDRKEAVESPNCVAEGDTEGGTAPILQVHQSQGQEAAV